MLAWRRLLGLITSLFELRMHGGFDEGDAELKIFLEMNIQVGKALESSGIV